ncbi:MAG: 3-deoxy-manno-octulosonate cytidylyltransferase [Acidobacteria bacterium]|nr:MAG: 3-deoxy-manno-octulosonate cytidylyltransferase [Acidobacteriota bacterium]
MRKTPGVLGVIPARMASTRLPGKPLLPIVGVPMIQRVYEGAADCRRLHTVVVATDSAEIATFCRAHAIPVRLTSAAHTSGTDRVWQVAQEMGAAAVVNIQGDEPMVRAEMLEVLVDALFREEATQVASLYTVMEAAEAQLPSACKVVLDGQGRALYFSRAAIPFPREGQPQYYKHLGYYAYSREALEAFHGWAPTMLEMTERLEQLRFLHHGVEIAMAETPYNTIGIDTAEDLAAAEALIRGANRQYGVEAAKSKRIG